MAVLQREHLFSAPVPPQTAHVREEAAAASVDEQALAETEWDLCTEKVHQAQS